MLRVHYMKLQEHKLHILMYRASWTVCYPDQQMHNIYIH